MKVALIEVEVLSEENGISKVRSSGHWGKFENEFYIPSDLIVDGRYLRVVDCEDGEFIFGAETYAYDGELYEDG